MSIPEPNHPLVRLAPGEAALLERVKTLAAERFGPDADRVAQQDVFAWDTFRLLCSEGIVATAFPRAYGGTEALMMLRVRIIEEVAAVCSTTASLVTGTDLSSRPIVAGASEALKRALLRAYFSDGENVADRDVLVRIARVSGLDADAARRVLDNGEYADAVRAQPCEPRRGNVEIGDQIAFGDFDHQLIRRKALHFERCD